MQRVAEFTFVFILIRSLTKADGERSLGASVFITRN